MDILKQLFRDQEINIILEQIPNIKKHNKENISKIIKLLADQKCNNKELRNIILTNPDVLLKNPEDIEELIYKLKEYNVLHLNKSFDNYPYLLNLKPYEIDTFIFLKQKEGLKEEEIIKILEDEPYLIEINMV